MADGSPISIAVIGFTPIADGIGCRIIRGAGHRFIMVPGSATHVWAGVGCQGMYGGLHGFPGATTINIVVGRPCRPVRISLLEWE